MTKLEALSKNGITLTQAQLSVFSAIANQNFITVDLLTEVTGLSLESVKDSIGILLEKSFIEDSVDSYIVSDDGIDVLLDAAVKYTTENNIIFESKATRKPRAITGDMNNDKGTIEELAKERIEVKAVRLNRSNYEIVLPRNKMRLRHIEVRNDGLLRVMGAKMSEEHLKLFTDINMTYRIGATGNVYIDGQRTQELIISVLDLIATELRK